jgi:hypothetical protein
MAERVYGHAPRVRRKKNDKRGFSPSGPVIEINGEIVVNKAVDAAISAGVAYIISRGI